MNDPAFVFQADQLSFDAPEDVSGVYFTGSTNGQSHYLLISRYNDPDDMDGFHIERDDQAFSCYGGAVRVTLSSTSLLINTTPEGAQHLGYPALEVHFTASQAALSQLRETLASVFAGSACAFVYEGRGA